MLVCLTCFELVWVEKRRLVGLCTCSGRVELGLMRRVCVCKQFGALQDWFVCMSKS